MTPPADQLESMRQHARAVFEAARKAVADYGGRGTLDPDDDIAIDVIDLTLDAIESMLPAEDKKNDLRGGKK